MYCGNVIGGGATSRKDEDVVGVSVEVGAGVVAYGECLSV